MGHIIEMFSEARIALMKEVNEHWPVIAQTIANSETGEWSDHLGIIAAWCGIAMDGYYSQAQLEHLTDTLVWRLRAARKGIVMAKPKPTTN